MQLDRVRNALRNPIIIPRYLNQRRKLLQHRYRQRHNHGIFAVKFQRELSFFAPLTWCAYVLSYCHEVGLIPHVANANPLYTDRRYGPDCFAYFFENPQQAFIDANVVEHANVRRIQELGLPTRCIAQMTLERASGLMRRYMPVRGEILDEVERFVQQHFEDGVVLGVHLRGTDKASEAPLVSPERCVAVIRRVLTEHPDVDRLFVASDVAPFVEYLRSELQEYPVVFCDDQRSDGTVAVHRAAFGGDRYRKGREALVNCLLLSRCRVLIRTASTLSGWASVFNPQLPVIMLNQPHAHSLWFPDRCVIARATLATEAAERETTDERR